MNCFILRVALIISYNIYYIKDKKMDTEIITLSGILDFCKDDTNSVRKGELKLKSNFVLDLRINDLTINTKVRATMKDKSYNVSLTIDGFGRIRQATCQCPRGKWICSHMAAASIYVNKKGLSKTDLPNSWIALPKRAAKQEVRTISDFFPHQRPDYKGTSRKVDESDKQFLFEKLSASAACPLHWFQMVHLCVSLFKLISYLNYSNKIRANFLRNAQSQKSKSIG